MLAQSALWVGLLYDDAALAAAEALLRGRRLGGCGGAAGSGAAPGAWPASVAGGDLRDLARDVVAIARDGLRAPGAAATPRGRTNRSISRRWRRSRPAAPTQAEHWLARYRGAVAG